MTINDLLVQPPGDMSPSAALMLSQQAPKILPSEPTSSKPFPISLFTAAESSETWTKFENLLLACLRAGDDKSAKLCIEKITERFGVSNERVMGLRSMYQEAIAPNTETLDKLLHHYNKILETDPVNMPIAKRRVALLKSTSRPTEAIGALVDLLETSPTDVEAWCELSDLYQAQGLGLQAIFSLEEALLITPNAWNLHARIGELNYIIANPSNSEGATGGGLKYLIEAMQRFCRSIELCDDYLRGYYGLKMTTGQMLEVPTSSFKGYDGAVPSRSNIQALNKLATEKLAAIVQADVDGDETFQAQIIAARELLDRDTAGKK